jgi:hypothetical protein
MNDTLTKLIDKYFAVWNEANASRRQQLIAQTWTEDAIYIDPLTRGEGHAGINGMIAAVQQQFAGLEFRPVGNIDAHNDRARFSWELGPPNAPAIAGGTDFAVIADERLQSVTGFLDFLPAQK